MSSEKPMKTSMHTFKVLGRKKMERK